MSADVTTVLRPSSRTASNGRRSRVALGVLWVAILGIGGLLLSGQLPNLASGVFTIVLMLLLMGATVPVGIAMLVASAGGLFSIGGGRVTQASVESIVFDNAASWSLIVIPMFILMGVAMWRGGITTLAYNAARTWLGWMPGGLAVATNFAGAGLASASGSTLGISMALGRMAIPEMYRAGYSQPLATATVAMAGTLGQIIPPSVLLVLYAGVAQTPVGPQLIAGIVPGIIIALGFTACIVVWAMVRPGDAPRVRLKVGWADRLRSLGGLVPLLVIVLGVIGGMLAGFFTATEAAAVGAVLALAMSVLTMRRPQKVRDIISTTWQGLVETVSSTAGIFLMIMGALLLSRTISLSGLGRELSAWIVSLGLDRVELLLLLIVVYIFLGMFLESFPMMVLTIPFLQAPLEAVGVDMIWFGIFIVIMCEIGMVFPPVGIITFVVHRLAQLPEVAEGRKTSLQQVFYGVMPFVGVSIAIAILLIFVPEIVLWLPDSAAIQ